MALLSQSLQLLHESHQRVDGWKRRHEEDGNQDQLVGLVLGKGRKRGSHARDLLSRLDLECQVSPPQGQPPTREISSCPTNSREQHLLYADI